MWIKIDERIEGGFFFTCSDDFPRRGVLSFEAYRTWIDDELLMLHRIFTRGSLAAIIRLDMSWWWLCVGFDQHVSPLNPIRSNEVESCCERPEVWFKDSLISAGGLGPGRFLLNRVSEHEFKWILGDEAVTTKPWFVETSGDLIPLRKASDPESGRVKWYRKLAKAGELPPVFTFRHEGLLSSLIVDGHDRLQAALLEGLTPTIWEISRVRIVDRTLPDDQRARIEAQLAAELAKPEDRKSDVRVDSVNGQLRWMYESQWLEHRPVARMIPGGLETWRADVSRLKLFEIFLGKPQVGQD